MSLTREQRSFYEAEGYVAPLRAIPRAQADGLRTQLEAFERDRPELAPLLRNKTHLVFTWLDALIRAPGILDAVESLLGPDILCWGSGFFIKNPGDGSFVSWHQDSTYWGLEPPDIVTAWVAISESVPANGAMRVIPRTHLQEQLAHRDTFAAGNLLSRGQEIAVDVNEDEAISLALAPGEMSLHHVRLVHGSEPNPSDRRRIGFAIRYLPTRVRQVAGTTDSATLVRGHDRFGHFRLETPPRADLDATALAHHAEMMGVAQQILMRRTG